MATIFPASLRASVDARTVPDPEKTTAFVSAISEKPLRAASPENYDRGNEGRLVFFISYLCVDASTAAMIHYTCDRCQRSIDLDEGPRYVVRIDVEVIANGADDSIDDEAIDFLAELNELLAHDSPSMNASFDASEPLDDLHDALCRGEDLDLLDCAISGPTHDEDFDSGDLSPPPSYDLCPSCYAEYAKNPLSRERALKLHFSNN